MQQEVSMTRYARVPLFLPFLAFLLASPLPLVYSQVLPQAPVEGSRFEEGQPRVMIHPTVEDVLGSRGAAGGTTLASTSNNLAYNGGVGGIGVETMPKLYLVLWGSQWNNTDPSGEASILHDFYNGVGGSSWLDSVTQYCQGVPTGTIFCNGAGQPAGNPTGGILAGVWYDNTSLAPAHPSQSQLAAEAVHAAQHFGNTSGVSNASTQYVIATATGNSSSGFGKQYCAYHSSTTSSVGNVAYTNLPYITDVGASCGANFNGLGQDAGITIISGHELAETITDQFPSGGWTDSSGAENADKCAWISSGQGAAAKTTLSTGTFAVQSLWSNRAGGCVLSASGQIQTQITDLGRKALETYPPASKPENPTEFELEKYLEEFMVSNFDSIFHGQLVLYKNPNEPQVTGQQYLTDVGVIDILATEPATESLVVIELKKGRASDVVVGQILRDMGWVAEKLSNKGQTVKGMII